MEKTVSAAAEPLEQNAESEMELTPVTNILLSLPSQYSPHYLLLNQVISKESRKVRDRAPSHHGSSVSVLLETVSPGSMKATRWDALPISKLARASL